MRPWLLVTGIGVVLALLPGCAEAIGQRARPVVERALDDAECGICQGAATACCCAILDVDGSFVL